MPRIPLTWLAEHVELPAGLTAEQLAADLVRVGLEEEAIHAAAVTGPLVVGEVVELTPEPQKNGKTINWCRVDVGPEHNEPGGDPRGIVCGAHNFVVGDRVVVALPGAVLPGPFAIASRKTYGHVSDGMICSARELGLGDDHAGIIVLSEPRARRARRHGRARAARPRRGGPRDQRDPRPRVLLLDARRRPRVRPVDRCGVHRPRPADGRRASRAAAASRSRSTTRRRSTGSRAPTASSRRSCAACARTTRRPRGCSAGCSRPACGRSASPSTSPTT